MDIGRTEDEIEETNAVNIQIGDKMERLGTTFAYCGEGIGDDRAFQSNFAVHTEEPNVVVHLKNVNNKLQYVVGAYFGYYFEITIHKQVSCEKTSR